MEEVIEEFEAYVEDLKATLRAGALTGTDGERALTESDQLIRDYRVKLRAEEVPSRGRELLERFKREAARL